MQEIIFVYNAGSGLFDRVSDFAHKIIAPKTYACQLCQVTHHAFGPKREWTKFLEHLPYTAQFYHKDQWEKTGARAVKYPAVLLKKDESNLILLLDGDKMSELNDLSDLKSRILQALEVSGKF